MTQSYIVKAAAWLEIIVGVVFITVPDLPCTLLFDAKPEGIGRPLARWIGIGLFALGIACVPSKATELRRTELGLFAFNAGIAILLAWVGISVAIHGFLLWPGVILHSLISIAALGASVAQCFLDNSVLDPRGNQQDGEEVRTSSLAQIGG
jgi:hypothetical protein